MFSSPNSAHVSPLHHSSLGQSRQFPDSPSDSRVPRTPSVARQNFSLDQSVPFTPRDMRIAQHDSPDLTGVTVPSTPDMVASLSDSALSPSLAVEAAHDQQAVSHTSAPSRSDQLVPSTPKNLREHKQGKSCTPEPFCATLLSPVPHVPAATGSQGLLNSPSPLAHRSCNEPCEESGYLSIDESRRNGERSSLLSPSAKNVSSSGGSGHASSSCSIQPTRADVSRKHPPPSRRRLSLSLSRQGQQDTLRRTAHRNLAVQRYAMSTAQRADPVAHSSVFDEIFASAEEDNPHSSHTDSAYAEISVEESVPLNTPVKDIAPLTSPAGDADSLLVNSTQASQQRMKNSRTPQKAKEEPVGAGNIEQVSSTVSTATRINYLIGNCTGKSAEPLNLFSEDNIFI